VTLFCSNVTEAPLEKGTKRKLEDVNFSVSNGQSSLSTSNGSGSDETNLQSNALKKQKFDSSPATPSISNSQNE
jgi:ABC-type Na+ efflux pump permease subunit